MKKFKAIPGKGIVASRVTCEKYFNSRLSEEEQLDRLHVSAKEVASLVMKNILNKDKDTFSYLIENKIIPTIVSSPDLRNNPYYDIEDKLIVFQEEDDGYRLYRVPYAGQNKFEYGNIYDVEVAVYDDGDIAFNGSRKLSPRSLKPATLKSYFWKSK